MLREKGLGVIHYLRMMAHSKGALMQHNVSRATIEETLENMNQVRSMFEESVHYVSAHDASARANNETIQSQARSLNRIRCCKWSASVVAVLWVSL